jgi:hypothetical protein
MTKFSSFKEQQLITENWRSYNNISEAQVEPVKPNTFKTNNQEKPEEIQKPEEIEKPEQKDLKAFQNRQTQVTNFTPQVVAQKIMGYLKTLKGFDLQKNNAMVLNSLRMLTKEFTDASSNQVNQTKQAIPNQQVKQQKTSGQSPTIKESIYDDAHLDDGLGFPNIGLDLLHPASLPGCLLPHEHHPRYHHHAVREHQERAER